MGRLPAFDYTSPFFYMVTLKKRPRVRAFSEIATTRDPPRNRQGRRVFLFANDLTRAFAAQIRTLHRDVPGIAPVTCFIVMPDHIHLLIRILAGSVRPSLVRVVSHLLHVLASVHGDADAFLPDWHDWIVKRAGQLARFTRYIRRNPEMAWVRKTHPELFRRVRDVKLLGRNWSAYGNLELLDLPVLAAVRGHRATPPGSRAWSASVASCSRLGPGGAGIGTFMSPLEKACANAVVTAGGSLILLHPQGFRDRWHPPERLVSLTAEGRILFLSPYEAVPGRLSAAELGRRCHEMGDWVCGGLPVIEG